MDISSPAPLFDAHNHLQDAWLAPHHPALLRELPALGLRGAVVNGSSPEDWDAVSALCSQAAWLIPSYGLHPWDVGNHACPQPKSEAADQAAPTGSATSPVGGEAWLQRLEGLLLANPRAAVGEIGLDLWMINRAAPDDPRLEGMVRAPLEVQQEALLAQLALARRLGRAASIHCLDAFGPLLELLRKAPLPGQGFLLHAYSGPAELVPAFVELGAYFSFNGAFTDPRKKRAREAFRAVPLERLLVETDAPAMCLPGDRQEFALPLSPSGQPINHPGNIRATHNGLAELRGMEFAELCSCCAANFSRLFLLP